MECGVCQGKGCSVALGTGTCGGESWISAWTGRGCQPEHEQACGPPTLAICSSQSPSQDGRSHYPYQQGKVQSEGKSLSRVRLFVTHGRTVRGILQVRILEWVAFPFSSSDVDSQTLCKVKVAQSCPTNRKNQGSEKKSESHTKVT